MRLLAASLSPLCYQDKPSGLSHRGRRLNESAARSRDLLCCFEAKPNSGRDGVVHARKASSGRTDLSVGQSCENLVQPPDEKYFALLILQIRSMVRASRTPWRGALRDRHERWVRDAMDAAASAPNLLRGRLTPARTAKSCGPGAPTLAPSCAVTSRSDDGGNQARSPRRARRKP